MTKLGCLFWFYLLAGLGIWGAIPFLLFDNVIIIAICCWFIWNKWGGYVGLWYMTQRSKINPPIQKKKDDDDIDFGDL